MSRSCDNCGAEVPAEARYCDNCGMPVSEAAPPQEAPTQQAPPAPPSSPPPQPSSPSLPPPSQPPSPSLPPPPPVGEPPISVPPPPLTATREGDERFSGRFRMMIVLLLFVLIVLLGGTAYALTRGTSQEVRIPDLVGASSVSEAQTMVGRDFEVVEDGRVESREPVGTVLSQDPAAGEMLGEGLSIFVNVSKGANLPDVRGQTREEAARILKEAGFEVEEGTEESSAGNKGYVTEQDPQGGKSVSAEAGSTVKITVGEGPPIQPSQKASSSAPKRTPPPQSAEKKIEEPKPKPPPPPADKRVEEPKPGPSPPPVGEGVMEPEPEEPPSPPVGKEVRESELEEPPSPRVGKEVRESELEEPPSPPPP